MGILNRAVRPGRIIELGTCGQARYARMASGETIWWGSEEDVPDAVALAAAAPSGEDSRAQAAPDRDWSAL